MPLSKRVYCDSHFELQGCLSLQKASLQYRSGVIKVRQGGSILQSLLFITFNMGLKGRAHKMTAVSAYVSKTHSVLHRSCHLSLPEEDPGQLHCPAGSYLQADE